MRKFFKGWRRKAGCLALVTALVLAGAWMRSLTIRDQVVFPDRNENLILYSEFVSALGAVRWSNVDSGRLNLSGESVEASKWPLPVWMSGALVQNEVADHYWQQTLVAWRWNYGGFDFGAGVHQGQDGALTRIESWAVPYWSLALPMTILSAYLILSKPRKVPTELPKI